LLFSKQIIFYSTLKKKNHILFNFFKKSNFGIRTPNKN